MQQFLSINDFCQNAGISRPFFYKLKARGEAPEGALKVGRRVLLPVEAVERWLATRPKAA